MAWWGKPTELSEALSGVHPSLLFLLAFNRDEYFSRETAGFHTWTDIPEIIAPRDLERNGTWLGISTTGRVSFLTNIRVPNPQRSPLSRGLLPVDFLTGTQSPSQFFTALDLHEYAPLNLFTGQLFGDIELALMNSVVDKKPLIFQKGVHGVSNGRINDPTWHKVERGKIELKRILEEMRHDENLPFDEIFENVLGHSEEVPAGIPLPDTGVEEWREHKLSAMFIRPFWNFGLPGGLYGTRSQIVIAVWKDKSVEIKERIWDADQRCQEQEHSFHLI